MISSPQCRSPNRNIRRWPLSSRSLKIRDTSSTKRGGGKSYEYRPIVPKEEYAHSVMSGLLSSYFDGSLAQMVSFFSRREDLSIQEAEQILDIIRETKRKTDKP